MSKCSVYATLGVAFWVFVEACNKGVGEDPVRIPMIDVGVIRWRYTIGPVRPLESSERLSASPPSAAGECLPASPINLVLMLHLWYYLVVCALSTPLTQQN